MDLTHTRTTVLFQYKNGNTLLHTIPAWIKLLLIVVCCTATYRLPLIVCSIGVIPISIISFYSTITLKEQLSDLFPVFFYAITLYILTIWSNIYSFQIDQSLLNIFKPSKNDITIIFRFFVSMQITALFLRTTSSMQLKTGISDIETAIRKILPVSKKNRFTQYFLLFLLFIPQIFQTWHSLEKAWFARQGKNGVRKIIILFPQLITVCMHHAYTVHLAMLNRN